MSDAVLEKALGDQAGDEVIGDLNEIYGRECSTLSEPVAALRRRKQIKFLRSKFVALNYYFSGIDLIDASYACALFLIAFLLSLIIFNVSILKSFFK